MKHPPLPPQDGQTRGCRRTTGGRLVQRCLGVAATAGALWSCRSEAVSSPESVTPAALVPAAGALRAATPRGGGARVYSSPYAGVNWSTDYRLKVQLHDHTGTAVNRIRAYDLAGYDVVSLMDYSGARALSYARTSVPWPVTDWLPGLFLGQLTSIKFFIPNAEQVGYAHLTSPFLGTYIERWQDSVTPTPLRAPWQYASSQEAIALINRYGGMAFLAHPWDGPAAVSRLDRYAGMEIYSAFARYRIEEGVDPYFTTVDRNDMLRAAWDLRLLKNQSTIGIAVNDHFGPDNPSPRLSARTRDSGKILVLAGAATPGALRMAMERRAVLAVEDIGITKGQFPIIDSIVRGTTSLTIATAGTVTWISNGRRLDIEDNLTTLDFSLLPPGAVYVRAEVTNAEGSRVYTQAFPVRRVGDSDGDGDIDAADDAICVAVRVGTDRVADHSAACAARLVPGGSGRP